VDVLIYVLADHRMEIEGAEFDTEFAGPLMLEPVASEETDLVDLLTGQPYYVTKLRRWDFMATEITDDLYLKRAASDEPYRRVIYRAAVDPVDACCSGCCPGLAMPVLMVGLGLVARGHKPSGTTSVSSCLFT